MGLVPGSKLCAALGLASLAAGGCAPGELAEACWQQPPGGAAAAPVPVTVMSYNLANEGAGARGETIAAHILATAPDLVAAQECAGCDFLLGELGGRFEATGPQVAGVAILYDPSAWVALSSGTIPLGENDDGWGPRVAAWGRFAHVLTGERLDLYSTHFCVTIRSTEDSCTEERQLDYALQILEHARARTPPETPVVLAGDLNVFDGFEHGPVVSFLLDAGLVDLYRAADPEGDGTTFPGNAWAPPGRIDYIFAIPPVEVADAYVDRDSVEDGAGSDHYAVVATAVFTAPVIAPACPPEDPRTAAPR
jgi:endonuclease/exonuclease/phosphatase family metal-dependent hydrolase